MACLRAQAIHKQDADGARDFLDQPFAVHTGGDGGVQTDATSFRQNAAMRRRLGGA